MPTFIIEREIPGASTLTRQELADITAKSNQVVAGLGVPYRWLTSYVAGDKIYCVHQTDEVETIREHARCGGFPADLVAEVTEQIGPDFTAHPRATDPVADRADLVEDGA
jgi:hypothetical protein